MSALRFTVPGAPVPKARARAYIRAGHVAHYTPPKTARYEHLVALAARDAMGGCPLFAGPVALLVAAWMPVPQSWSKKRRQAALAGVELPAHRPDLDNLLKAVLDGLNGIVWIDDAQVIAIDAAKRYSEEPRVEVVVQGVVNDAPHSSLIFSESARPASQAV